MACSFHPCKFTESNSGSQFRTMRLTDCSCSKKVCGIRSRFPRALSSSLLLTYIQIIQERKRGEREEEKVECGGEWGEGGNRMGRGRGRRGREGKRIRRWKKRRKRGERWVEEKKEEGKEEEEDDGKERGGMRGWERGGKKEGKGPLLSLLDVLLGAIAGLCTESSLQKRKSFPGMFTYL